MIHEILKYLLNQSLLTLLLFPIFLAISFWLKKSQTADWRSALWTLYFAVSITPFELIGRLIFVDEIKSIRWIRISESSFPLESANLKSQGSNSFDWEVGIVSVWLIGLLFSFLLFVVLPILKEKRMLKKLELKRRQSIDHLYILSKDSRLNKQNIGRKEEIYPPVLPIQNDEEMKSAVFLTEKKVLPFVSGYLFPKIIFPIELFSELTKSQLKSVYLHELSHKKSFDPLRLLFARTVSCVFWYLPSFIYCNKKLLETIEIEADGFALSQSCQGILSNYAQTMLDLMFVSQNESWSSVGLGILTKNHLFKRIATMKNSTKRKKANFIFPTLVLVILLPFSFAIGRATDTKVKEKTLSPWVVQLKDKTYREKRSSRDFVTVEAKITSQDGTYVARPSMISELGRTAHIIMGDRQGRGSWFLELTVEESGKMMIGNGRLCFTIEEFEPGKFPECTNKHKFSFAQASGKASQFSIENIPYNFEFIIHKGVWTEKFLRNIEGGRNHINVLEFPSHDHK